MGQFIKTSTILLASTIILLSFTASALSDTTAKIPSVYSGQYTVLNQELFVCVQPSLYTYYNNITHSIPYESDYARFIKPQTVQPIADNILKITRNMPYPDEHFANAVLSLVHQIPYNLTGAKYPVETLVDNRGDCGSLSILAASIMKAGGLDVVLIKYSGIDPGHMNVGVYLPYTPVYHSLLMPTVSFLYDNKTYWTAEATPEGDWKVGDQSFTMANAKPIIIPLDASEQSSPGQVSSSFIAALSPSSISVNVLSQPSSNQISRSLVISGFIQPVFSNSSISIFINKGSPGVNYVSAVTDVDGRYSFIWNFTLDGTYYISTSWSGSTGYAGADSETNIVFIGPESLIQFQTDSYNYIVGIGIGDIAVRPYVGVNDFLSVPLGTNVSVSYSFLVLQTGHSASNIPTKNVTIPASHYIIRDKNRHLQTIQVPARTVTTPASIPLGQEPLVLPADFNQTINSNFCFVVKKNMEGNYSLNAQGLDDYDVSSIQESNSTSSFLLNATQDIAESTWYRVTTTISKNGITADLQSEDGTPIQSISASNSLECSQQLVLSVANNVDSAIVLKDFQVNDGKAPVQPIPQEINQPPAPIESLFPFAITVVILAATLIVAVAIIDVKKTKKNQLADKTA